MDIINDENLEDCEDDFVLNAAEDAEVEELDMSEIEKDDGDNDDEKEQFESAENEASRLEEEDANYAIEEEEEEEDDDDEKDGVVDLEKIVFGGEDDMEDQIDEYVSSRKRKGEGVEAVAKKPKWEDDDDADKIDAIANVPAWAKKRDDDEGEAESSDDEDGIQGRTGDYVSTSKYIGRNQLKILKCLDINKECPTKGKVRVMEFLSKAQVAIVAAADTSLTLFQVDGKTNRKIQTVILEKFPVFAAHFSADGNEILVGSPYPTMVSYNMNSGKTTKFCLKGFEHIKNTKVFSVSPDSRHLALVGSFGHVHILSAKSKKCLHTLKVESEQVEAIAFSPDGSELYSHGDGGVVNVWSMKTFKCAFRFQDEGCVLGHAIAVSPDGKYLATGTSTGIVNVYDRTTLNAGSVRAAKYQLPRPKPVKAVENLVSPCTSLAFNHTSELLAMASNYADNAVKMLHLQSMSVFANFPSTTKTVGVPYSIGFSPNSGYFAVGNHNGHTHTYRMQHYSSY